MSVVDADEIRARVGGDVGEDHQARHQQHDGRQTRGDQKPQWPDAHGFDGLDLLADCHGAQLRRVSRADARRQDDAGHQRPEFAAEGGGDQLRHEALRAEGAQLITRQQRHRQPQEKRDHHHQRDGFHAGALGLHEEDLTPERQTPAREAVADLLVRSTSSQKILLICSNVRRMIPPSATAISAVPFS